MPVLSNFASNSRGFVEPNNLEAIEKSRSEVTRYPCNVLQVWISDFEIKQLHKTSVWSIMLCTKG